MFQVLFTGRILKFIRKINDLANKKSVHRRAYAKYKILH